MQVQSLSVEPDAFDHISTTGLNLMTPPPALTVAFKAAVTTPVKPEPIHTMFKKEPIQTMLKHEPIQPPPPPLALAQPDMSQRPLEL